MAGWGCNESLSPPADASTGAGPETTLLSPAAGEGDGDADLPGDEVDAASNDAGDSGLADARSREVAVVLPPLSFSRRGAPDGASVGGLLSSVAISPGAEGSELRAAQYLGFEDGCAWGPCMQTEHLPQRVLSAEEAGKLRRYIDAVPSGDCFEESLGACNPGAFTDVALDGRLLPFGRCVHELCPGYSAAVARLANLMERLARPSEAIEDSDDCYAPTQNLRLAYDPGAQGCGCDWPGQGVCVGGVALICDQRSTSPHAVWNAVIDGPCWLMSCDEAGAFDDLASCLAGSRLCYELSNGKFCIDS